MWCGGVCYYLLYPFFVEYFLSTYNIIFAIRELSLFWYQKLIYIFL